MSRSSSQVRTPGFHPGNRGSNPLRDATFLEILQLWSRHCPMPYKSPDIIVSGATQNNLKDISARISPGELTVITGLSGTGKSTLLFDVLHAEGQRRYVETFSPYVRQFLDTLPRPEVNEIKNARPSIAVEQKNTVKNSRSTVGTMTELCDYFKIWFSEIAVLIDPKTGKRIEEKTPESLVNKILKKSTNENVIIGFQSKKPQNSKVEDFFAFLTEVGHRRIFFEGEFQKISSFKNAHVDIEEIFVVVDMCKATPKNRVRITDAVKIAIESGNGAGEARSEDGSVLEKLILGLRSDHDAKRFKPAKPNLFSFNSPQGACPSCRGFGKTILIDREKVIPDSTLSIREGAVRAFSGKVFSHCQEDLMDFCNSNDIDPDKPFQHLKKNELDLIWNGSSEYKEENTEWYGITNFFKWVEKKSYKMHIRVFLSKYRGYFICEECSGQRLRKESMNWKWNDQTLPELYAMTVDDLNKQLPSVTEGDNQKISVSLSSIRKRLKYLKEVGLGYLSLDRPSKTLSGGETQRVNLTTCLGSALTDSLFALDEPTIGLHGRDIGKLIEILRKLADAGNCVCVVEHDEQVIRSADKVIEIGPSPGSQGGYVTFSGKVNDLIKSESTATAKWLKKRLTNKKINSSVKKPSTKLDSLNIKDASVHNLNKFEANIPLGSLVCIAGVSGSGKSTLASEIIFKGLHHEQRVSHGTVKTKHKFSDVVSIDQNTISRTPRSNAILYSDGWNPIKEALGRTEMAKLLGYTASDFSFNTGNGRCEECSGLGYELVEMQFLSDIQVPCSYCNGFRFKDDILSVKLDNLSVSDILSLDVDTAVNTFKNFPKTFKKLSLLQEVGLGYLALGQPLNTLSGGESQRLKLVKYLGSIGKGILPAIILIDEPTTGLHMQDVEQLISTLKRIVAKGHSVIVVEHNLQVLRAADWILEMGPGAGKEGGKLVASGTPENFKKKNTATSRLLFPHLSASNLINSKKNTPTKHIPKGSFLHVVGAKENNLRNLELKIPHHKFVVVTGPSGSGKSSLAFDVVFAEGQRRFMESMSAYARQFVQQMPKPKVDSINGMPPTVAIEQRVTRGSKKSTVGSITEVAQYLRLLYAKIGTQLSESTKLPLEKFSVSQIEKKILNLVRKELRKPNQEVMLLSPLVTGRKGHHKPIVNWALEKGYSEVRCDGIFYKTNDFPGLDRYRLHDVDAVVGKWSKQPSIPHLKSSISMALKSGNGRCLLTVSSQKEDIWFSTRRVDPSNGKAYPELEPSFFSWNSGRGRCEFCKGYGKIYDWMKDDLPASGQWWKIEDGTVCPECHGERLSSLARNVVLKTNRGKSMSMPQLLSLTPENLLNFLNRLKIEEKQGAVLRSILPEISERLKFMQHVGLSYLTLDRETSSLSGGEAQRIRLSGQLGSNLSGVLYVLDEPSIGLHPMDNQKLLHSLRSLLKKGNSLLVVEHDEETIEQADFLIDIGPEAGTRGGEIISIGKSDSFFKERKLLYNKNLTLEKRNKTSLPPKSTKGKANKSWLTLKNGSFRNISKISVDVPLARLTVCCGVSGAGKSSLVRGILFNGVKECLKKKSTSVQSDRGEILNANAFGKAIEVDQKPIGKTSRSTPATYLGIWDRIRGLFAQLQESKTRGYSPSTFSFNVKGGRCESCKGNGRIKLEMNFLPDSYISCTECDGRRFKNEILEIKWHGKNIAEILDLTFEEAHSFFEFDYILKETFELMVQTGLGYLKLGQSSATLSGGEAQRLKLASELANGIDTARFKLNRKIKPTFYVLEEPTIGLHQKDRIKLLNLLHRLVGQGHTIIVIEHDVELIASADYVIEMGPGGGANGGKRIYQGKVEGLLCSEKSNTGSFVKKMNSFTQ